MTFMTRRVPVFLAAGLGFALMGLTAAGAATRTFYVAAEEVEWDYAPEGRELMMGMDFDDDQTVFVAPGPSRIGSTYHKVRYIEYTDDTFNEVKPREDASLGILGPVVRAEVGDTIAFVLRNMSTVPVTAHPHGVFYDKDSEGAPTNDGTSDADSKDDMIMPGETYTYHWGVPERAGPGPNDGSSVVWLYHSHVHSIQDTNSGLVGPMVITRKGMANPDATPKDVDREFFSFFSVLNENESLFLDDMIAKLDAAPDEEGTTLLDNALVWWTHESGPQTHLNDSQPVIMAGSAGGAFNTGMYVDYRTDRAFPRTVREGGGTGRRPGLHYYQWFTTVLDAFGIPRAEWQEGTQPFSPSGPVATWLEVAHPYQDAILNYCDVPLPLLLNA